MIGAPCIKLPGIHGRITHLLFTYVNCKVIQICHQHGLFPTELTNNECGYKDCTLSVLILEEMNVVTFMPWFMKTICIKLSFNPHSTTTWCVSWMSEKIKDAHIYLLDQISNIIKRKTTNIFILSETSNNIKVDDNKLTTHTTPWYLAQ